MAEITILPSEEPTADIDIEGAVKPEDTKKEGKKKFTFFFHRKKSKEDSEKESKKDDRGKSDKKSKSKKREEPASKHEKKKKNAHNKKSKHMRILILGLDACGKTTILYKMMKKDYSGCQTTGFNAETVSYGQMKFAVTDVGGETSLRHLWRHYFSGTEGLIYVIDCADRERIGLAIEEFYRVIGDEEMKNAVILVFANKQDKPTAIPSAELEDRMELHHKLHDRHWLLQSCSGSNGEGLDKGFDWLKSLNS